MEVLTTLVSVIIVGIVAFLVGYPMIKSDQKDRVKALLDDAKEDDLLAKDKESILTTINEIEFDYSMKKLSEDDYQILKAKYKQAALQLLHEEEQEEFTPSSFTDKAKSEIEREIEEEIEKELKLEG